jgi:hypothetical protein
LKRSVLIAFGLAAVTPAAQAQEPTFEQLLATPSATEIAARWKSVCFDHAGNMEAQAKAAEDLKITWPYQVMFEAKRFPTCMVVSAIAPGQTARDLALAVAATDQVFALSNPEETKDKFNTSASINGRPFLVAASLKRAPGTTIAVIALSDTSKAFK